MAFTLAAYGNSAFQEFILPQINNDDYRLILNRDIFGFADNVTLNFEVVDTIWRFTGLSTNAKVRSTSGIRRGDELKLGSLLQIRQGESTVSLLVMELDQSLNRFKKYLVSRNCQLQIGSAEGCNITYDFQGLVSRTHAVLQVTADGCKITDMSKNGIYMGGKRLSREQMLHFGDEVNIFGLQIINLGKILAIGTIGQETTVWAPELSELHDTKSLYPNGYRQLNTAASRLFHRSPRMLPKLNTEPIEIEAVPQPMTTAKRPLILTIGPSMTMVIPMLLGSLVAILAASSSNGKVSPYMFTGIVIAAASAALGVMWGLINLKHAKKTEKEAEENRITRYQAYLCSKEEEIYNKSVENKQILDASYPPSSTCTQYDAYCPTLWNRNMSHQDMLFARLGLGDVEFQCPITIPKKKFTLYDDALADQPQRIQEQYKILRSVPVGVDLRERRLLGIVGDGNGRTANAIARGIAVQIAANCCYTDVKMAFIARKQTLESGGDWGFAKWLPHVWSENKSSRLCAANPSETTEICYELSEVIRQRMERAASDEGESETLRPHYIIFIEDMELVGSESILKQLLAPETAYGITTIILAPRRELLPNVCEDIVETNGARGTIYNLGTGVTGGTEVIFDSLSADAAESFARKITGVEVAEIETSGNIPDSITFLNMWGVKTLKELNVLDRWKKNRTYETMKALIGQRAGGQNWYLDIHEKHHGPHGLIAGTTGSGKSETLQTFILSLALNYSPDDVAFFIIDYKGGGMANLFSTLPHIAGQISNLSGNQVHRAMVSIMSENRRRQRLFNECGVNHIDNYTRLYKNGEAPVPLPHLLIIIDEFAELKKEENSFMRELISVAQVGRSLGVHLILATQKPSGTVDDNIWSNAKFRLCLRVQDRQDSNEMLHKPDAAYITQAGRGFMQVGNDEIYEEFQSGWSGADYDEALAEVNTNIASMHTNTGKSAIIGNHLKKQQKDRQRTQWLVQLASMFRQAEKKLGFDLASCVQDRAKLNQIIEEVFVLLEKEHIDYTKGKGNTLRLREFAAALAENETEDWTNPDLIQSIVRTMQVRNSKIPELKGKTQLAATVDYLAEVAQKNGYTHSFRLWLPVLPEVLYLDQLDGFANDCFDGRSWKDHSRQWSLDAIVGLSDNPANQIQTPYTVSLSEGGHVALCGAAGSGKSTFLQTLLFSLASRYSPEELNIYLLDFSNRSLAAFEELPHCGGVVYEDTPEKLGRFFNMLDQIIKQRKQTLRGGTYSQFVQVNGTQIPAMILAIDNYASFREKTDGTYESRLMTIAREGANYGIYLVVAAGGFGGPDIPNRIADNLRNVICLELGDKFKYGDVLHTIHFDVLPEAGVKGRGIAPYQGTILEFQTALPVEAEDDFSRANKMREQFRVMAEAWTGKLPRQIPEIPAEPLLADLTATEDYKTAIETPYLLPYAYHLEDASVCSVDLRTCFCWLIAGRHKTGKTTLLQILADAAKQKQGQICIADFGIGRLRKLAEDVGATYISDAEGLFNYTRELQAEFLRRNKQKQELLRSGLEESEIYDTMAEHPPIFMLIDDIAAFVTNVSKADSEYTGIRAFYENAAEKGSLHNIYFIACVDSENYAQVSGKKLFEAMACYKTGIHLGGNVSLQKLFDFSAMPFSEQTKQLAPGIGLLPQNMVHPIPRKVIIPKYK